MSKYFINKDITQTKNPNPYRSTKQTLWEKTPLSLLLSNLMTAYMYVYVKLLSILM